MTQPTIADLIQHLRNEEREYEFRLREIDPTAVDATQQLLQRLEQEHQTRVVLPFAGDMDAETREAAMLATAFSTEHLGMRGEDRDALAASLRSRILHHENRLSRVPTEADGVQQSLRLLNLLRSLLPEATVQFQPGLNSTNHDAHDTVPAVDIEGNRTAPTNEVDPNARIEAHGSATEPAVTHTERTVHEPLQERAELIQRTEVYDRPIGPLPTAQAASMQYVPSGDVYGSMANAHPSQYGYDPRYGHAHVPHYGLAEASMPYNPNSHYPHRDILAQLPTPAGSHYRPRVPYEPLRPLDYDANLSVPQPPVPRPHPQFTIPLMPREMRPSLPPRQEQSMPNAPSNIPTNNDMQANATQAGDSQAWNGSRTFTMPNPRDLNSAATALRKQFAGKMFSGTEVSSKLLSTDEVFFHLETFQDGQRCSDETIITNLVFLFTGEALNWWRSNYKQFRSLADARTAMYERFDALGSSTMGLRAKIANTKQSATESLSSYVDRMNCLMDRLPNEYPLTSRIEVIRMGSNRSSYNMLVGRAFADMRELQRFASQVSQGPEATSKTKEVSKTKDRRINAVEHEPEPDSDSDAQPDEESEDESVEAFVNAMAQMVSKFSKRPQNGANRSFKPKPKPIERKDKAQAVIVTKPDREIDGTEEAICPNCDRYGHRGRNCTFAKTRVYCYGCDRPGVYKSDCPNCLAKLAKN